MNFIKFNLLIILICSVIFVSCNSKKEQNINTNNKNIVKLAGSTSISPLIKKIKVDYEKNKLAKVEIQENGSSAGILSTIGGISNIAMVSRDLTKKEKEKGLEEITIALDGIVLVVNKENKIKDLTIEEVRKIFSGEIKNWEEVGGSNGEIIVVSRENGSGTKTSFEEIIKLQKKVIKDDKILTASLISKNALFENNAGAIKSNIKTSKNSIGYISLGTLDDTVKPISINGVYCSEESAKNGKYKIVRPLNLAFKQEFLDDISKDFLKYILSEKGQKIVRENGYISIK